MTSKRKIFISSVQRELATERRALKDWRDWLTEQVLAAANLNDRQRIAIGRMKIARHISNQEYQELTGATARTASRDLTDLATKGILQKAAKAGRATHYSLAKKPAINTPNTPNTPTASVAKGSSRARLVPKATRKRGKNGTRSEPKVTRNIRSNVGGTGSQLESQLESPKRRQLESLAGTVVRALAQGELSKSHLASVLKQKQASGQLHAVIRQLLEARLIERTIPDKPTSRLQQYRLTAKGRRRLAVEEP